MADLPVINALWISQAMGPVHAACLLSFKQQGHRVVLHGYERPPDLPPGIEFSDARSVLPENTIFRHAKNGSYGPFSDVFRYEVLAAGLGVWADCDVYCLKPIQDAPYIVGWHGKNVLNGAILKLPTDCPALKELRQLRFGVYDVPWLKRKHWQDSLRRLIRMPAPLAKVDKLALGPLALTWFAKKHGIDRYAAPPDVYYPVHFNYVRLLFDPGVSLADLVTRRTVAIHLYNEVITRDKLSNIPPGSPLAEMLKNSPTRE